MASIGTERSDPSFAVERETAGAGHVDLRFRGHLRFKDAAPMWKQVRAMLEPSPDSVHFDLSAVESADSGTIALLVELHCRLGSFVAWQVRECYQGKITHKSLTK